MTMPNLGAIAYVTDQLQAKIDRIHGKILAKKQLLQHDFLTDWLREDIEERVIPTLMKDLEFYTSYKTYFDSLKEGKADKGKYKEALLAIYNIDTMFIGPEGDPIEYSFKKAHDEMIRIAEEALYPEHSKLRLVANLSVAQMTMILDWYFTAVAIDNEFASKEHTEIKKILEQELIRRVNVVPDYTHVKPLQKIEDPEMIYFDTGLVYPIKEKLDNGMYEVICNQPEMVPTPMTMKVHIADSDFIFISIPKGV